MSVDPFCKQRQKQSFLELHKTREKQADPPGEWIRGQVGAAINAKRQSADEQRVKTGKILLGTLMSRVRLDVITWQAS